MHFMLLITKVIYIFNINIVDYPIQINELGQKLSKSNPVNSQIKISKVVKLISQIVNM